MDSRMACRCELWDGVISSPFLKDASVCPTLKEALKLLSLVFGDVEPLRSWSRLSVRNLPEKVSECALYIVKH